MSWFRREPRLLSEIRDLDLLPTLQSAWYPPPRRRTRGATTALAVFLIGLGGGVAVERVILAAPDHAPDQVVVLPDPNGGDPSAGGTAGPVAQLAAATGTATPEPATPTGAAGALGMGGLPVPTGSTPSAAGTTDRSTPTHRGTPAPGPSPATSAPGPSPSTSAPSPSTSTSAPAPSFCTVTYAFSSTWNDGFVVNVVLTNTSTSTWGGWLGSFSMSPAAAVVNSWGGTLGVQGTSVVLVPAQYNAWVSPGRSVTVGFQGSTTSGAPTLSGIRVSGNVCRAG